jgi:hypothetical protein
MAEYEVRERKRRKSSRASSLMDKSLLKKYEKCSYFVERFSFPIFLTIFAVYTVV